MRVVDKGSEKRGKPGEFGTKFLNFDLKVVGFDNGDLRLRPGLLGKEFEFADFGKKRFKNFSSRGKVWFERNIGRGGFVRCRALALWNSLRHGR